MNGLILSDNMKENGSIHKRVLGVLLHTNLKVLQPRMQHKIAASFANQLFSGVKSENGEPA